MSRERYPSGPEFLWKSIALALLLWTLCAGVAWVARSYAAEAKTPTIQTR